MYNVRWLARVAMDGLEDLVPAIRQAFNDDPGDDRLAAVYGARPRFAIIVIAVAGVLAGALFNAFGPEIPFKDAINWPAVAVGALYAVIIRRYLFGGNARAQDFPWLAASMVPAAALLVAITMVSSLWYGSPNLDGDMAYGPGPLLVTFTDALGVTAALAIAVATLCFSRNWLAALWDLVVRLAVFRLMIFITVLILLEIGIVGPIVAGVLNGIFHISLPQWLPDLFDQLSYFALMSVVYLAVIGATWTACRDSFGELLETGQVKILDAIGAMSQDPETRRRKAEKRKARMASKARATSGQSKP